MKVRVGAAAIGMLVGLVVGLILAVACAFLGALPSVPFAAWVFGSSLLLLFICFAAPSAAFLLFPGLAHFLAGAADGFVLEEYAELPQAESKLSPFLRAAFYAGVALSAAVWLYVSST